MLSLSKVNKKIFSVFLIYNFFFYHIFKSLNITLLLTSFCFLLILITPFIISIIKQNKKIYLKNIEIIILTIFLLIFIYTLKNCIEFYFLNNNNLVQHLSKNTFRLGVFFDCILLLSFLIYYFIFKSTDINLENIFFISSIICFILLTLSLFVLIFSNQESNIGWLNPHLYLFFFYDNGSAKLQHAYIFFIVISPFIFELYYKDRLRNKLIFVFSFFFLFLINSKLFFLLFLLYNFLLLIFFFNKKNILILFKMSVISIFLIIFSTSTISLIKKKEFSIINSFVLKYASILKIINIQPNYEKILNDKLYSNIIGDLSTRDTFYNNKFKAIENYFDSTYDRFERMKFCISNEGIKKKILPNNQTILINDDYKGGPYLENYFINKNKQKYINVNCEGSIFQIYYKYEKKTYFLFFFIFFIFFIFYKNKDLYSLIMFFLIILLSLQHLTLDNPITFVFMAILLTNKKFFFKKIT